MALLPQMKPTYPAALPHVLLHCPPARRAKVMVRVPNTVMRQPFLRSVQTKKPNVNMDHHAMIRVSPTTKEEAALKAGAPVEYGTVLMNLLMKKANQKHP